MVAWGHDREGRPFRKGGRHETTETSARAGNGGTGAGSSKPAAGAGAGAAALCGPAFLSGNALGPEPGLAGSQGSGRYSALVGAGRLRRRAPLAGAAETSGGREERGMRTHSIKHRNLSISIYLAGICIILILVGGAFMGKKVHLLRMEYTK